MVHDPGALKLDHLQPVKLFLFHKNSSFTKTIIYTAERGRKEGAGTENG